MGIINNFKIAFNTLLAYKVRSILTILSISIGVAAVTIIVAFGQSGESTLKNQLFGNSNNLLSIYYEPSEEELANSKLENLHIFSPTDVIAVSQFIGVKNAVGTNSILHQLDNDDDNSNIQIIGYDAGLFDILSLEISKGRLLNYYDNEESRKIALVSEEYTKYFLDDEHPIGKTIRINNSQFQIVGEYKETNSNIFESEDKKVILPIKNWSLLFGSDNIQELNVQIDDGADINYIGESIISFLNVSKGMNGNYKVLNIDLINEQTSTLTDIMTKIVAGIASISLIVAGIGVMNIMLLSVTERTREIGIRKALGATRKIVIQQFLIESIIITTIGGIIGSILGLTISTGILLLAEWPVIIPYSVTLYTALICILLGIIFGLLPANKAAKLDPIEALRHE